MKALRRWYWIMSAFVRKYLLGISVGLVVGIILVVKADAIFSLLPFTPTQRIGRVGAYTLEDLPRDIQHLVSQGLVRIDSTGDTILDAAQTVAVSEDGKKYTVTLNPQKFFSDGTRLTTNDINLEMKDVNITKISDEVISFELPAPFAPFPTVLSQPILKKIVTGRLSKKTEIIGLEKYRISDVQTYNNLIVSMVLESDTEKIHYFFYPTESDAVLAYKLGKVDHLQNISTTQLQDWPRSDHQFEYENDRYMALFFNTGDPMLQDKAVRQLLSYATPKDPQETRVISPISQSSWAYNPQVKPYDYNPETAISMLERLKTNNQDLTLSFVITTTPAYESTANQIAAAWTELGIGTSVKVVAFPDTSDYQILLIGQQIPNDPDQYALWHSTQKTNITQYKSPKVDKLLEDGRQEQDREKRKVIYQDFQRFLVEDAPVVFLHKLPLFQIHRLNRPIPASVVM